MKIVLLCRLALTSMPVCPSIYQYLGDVYLLVMIWLNYHCHWKLGYHHEQECGGLQNQADLWLNLHPAPSHLTSLNLSFLIYKIGESYQTSSHVKKGVCKVFHTVAGMWWALKFSNHFHHFLVSPLCPPIFPWDGSLSIIMLLCSNFYYSSSMYNLCTIEHTHLRA